MALYALTGDPTIVLRTDTCALVPTTGNWMSDQYQDWLAAGNTPDPLPVPTFADYVAAFTPGLQQWMETTAQGNAYDSVLSCVSYENSGVAQFAADAKAMKDWRDALWKWASVYQAGANGQLPNPLPTLEQIVSLAPQPEDFGWVVHPKGVIISSQLPPENPSA